MADVVLIYPKTGTMDIKKITLELPLSSLTVGTALEHAGYKVKVIDQRVHEDWGKLLLKELKSDPVFVGVSSMTGRQIKYGLDASRIVKDNSDVPVVWGGPHPSTLAEQTSNHPLVDIAVVGEGEETAIELAEALEKKKPLEKVKGLCISGKLTEPRKFIDLNEYEDHDYGLVDISNYFVDLFEDGSRGLHFITSRGCPHNCAFCFVPILNKHRWRSLTAENTVARLKRLVDDYKIDGLAISDDNFFADFKRADRICDLMQKEHIDIKWKALCRIDYMNRMEKSFLRKLKSRGLEFMFAGADSGSDRILKLMNKGITVNDIINANRKMKGTGITARYSFVIGIPGERRPEMLQSLRLANKLLVDNPDSEINGCLPFETLHGTPLYYEAVSHGFKEPETLEEWARNTSEEISRPWLTKAQEKELSHIYYLSRIIDGKAFLKYFKNSPLKLLLSKLYLHVARFRWSHNSFKFAPELDFIHHMNLREKIN